MVKKTLIFLLIIAIMTTVTVLGIMFYKSVDPYEIVSAFTKGKINLVIEDRPIKTYSYPVIKNNKVLIPVDILQKYIYEDVELDSQDDRLYVNIEKPIFKLEDESLDKRIDNGIRLNFLVEEIDDIHYINIKGLEKLFGIRADYIEESNILVIDKLKNNEEIGRVKKTTYLRPKKSLFAFRMDKLEEDTEFIVFAQEDEWLKVRTDKGFTGYVPNKHIDIEKREYQVNRQLNSIREDWEVDGKINLVWNYVFKYSPDLAEEDTIEGLDVISPTWFSVVSSNGDVINNGDITYVEEAHKKGYKVWGLIDNSFDRDLTRDVLSSEEAQENVINQLLVYASIYHLDGINIDFENVYYEDRDTLTNFVDKLTKELKKQNLVVSIDMTVPSSSKYWSMFYDREKLSKIVDYCIVMTYDEHWAASPTSGSVASIGWVKRGIEKTLKYVPNEKLIMGIPFYTREWEEVKDENGNIKVKSRALSMIQVENIIEENNAEVVWLDNVGQYYTEYIKDNKKYRIWIENDESIQLKADLVHKYNLAGTASWRKGFEKESVWTVLNNVIKKKKLVVENE